MSIINDTSGKVKHDLNDVLPYIDRGSWAEATRLYRVIKLSGTEGIAAWTALYRWLADRPHYALIREGLRQYFKDYTSDLLEGAEQNENI